MWDLPGPGLEPVSPALAGGFLTCTTREAPACIFYFKKYLFIYLVGCAGSLVVAGGLLSCGMHVHLVP